MESLATASVQRGPEISPRPPGNAVDLRPETEMRSRLLAVCEKPARPCDVKSFQVLHNPRLHSMAEWILQYEHARQRQDLYLNQIRDLRQLIYTKRRSQHQQESPATPRRFWTPAWNSVLSYQPQTGAKRGTLTTPNETCVLFAKELTPRKRLNRPEFWSGGHPTEVPTSPFYTVNRSMYNFRHNNATRSSASNRYINIVKNYNSGHYSGRSNSSAKASLQSMQVHGERRTRLPPIEGQRKLDRHKTEYEPFERISRRNKLNLTSFLSEERARVSSQHSTDLSEVRVEATPIPCSR